MFLFDVRKKQHLGLLGLTLLQEMSEMFSLVLKLWIYLIFELEFLIQFQKGNIKGKITVATTMTS